MHCFLAERGAPAFAVVLLMLVAAIASAHAGEAVGVQMTKPIEELIQAAGNADEDADRLAYLQDLLNHPGIPEGLAADTRRLIDVVDLWLHAPYLARFFEAQIREKGDYDFGIDRESPLYPLTQLYRARMLMAVTQGWGGPWREGEGRRQRFDMIRGIFEEVSEAFPENRIVRMYLGEPVHSDKHYDAAPGAPEWAVYQREALERWTDIVHWWIDHRMRDNGEFGGGWGDDCEMWRWWEPVLIGFNDPRISLAQARFSRALLDQDYLRDGYSDVLFDVEHTSEETADSITPMMHLDPRNPEWARRAHRLAVLMASVWTGVNDRGLLQFKSTYISVSEVHSAPEHACDTPYHTGAIQPALLYWQRTGDPEIGTVVCRWMDTWVDAAVRAECGKPSGILPAAIHWPDGAPSGLGKDWWDPQNYEGDASMYRWPGGMNQLMNTLLLTYRMTEDERYLRPIRTMADARRRYLANPPETPPKTGSEEWCAARMGSDSRHGKLGPVLAKCHFAAGDTEFDDLLTEDAPSYIRFRLTGERNALTLDLRNTAAALRINFPGYTSEVRYTDRLIRLPRLFTQNGIYPEAITTIHEPDTNLLYMTATGDLGSAGWFPLNAVRWMTPPRDIATLVTIGAPDQFEAELFHFGEQPRPMAAQLLLLAPREYEVCLLDTAAAGTDNVLFSTSLRVEGPGTRLEFSLPARRLCRLKIVPTAAG